MSNQTAPVPDHVREHSDSTETVYMTPLFTIYANRKIIDNCYEDTFSLTILLRNDDGFTEENVNDIVRALQEVEI